MPGFLILAMKKILIMVLAIGALTSCGSKATKKVLVLGRGEITINESMISSKDEITISCKVTNTGSRAGEEVVQLYLRDVVGSVTRPVKELKGFQKIWLEPGQSQTVNFTITPELLSFYDKDMKWIIEPGEFSIMVGTSSEKTESILLTVTK